MLESEIIYQKQGAIMQRKVATRFKSKKEFLEGFTRDFWFGNGKLSDSEAKVFAVILYFINPKNCFVDNADMRRCIARTYKMSQSKISQAFESLIRKGIISPLNTARFSRKRFDFYQVHMGVKRAYRISSEAIGKGSFEKLTNMKQTIKSYYDEERGFVTEIHNQFYYKS